MSIFRVDNCDFSFILPLNNKTLTSFSFLDNLFVLFWCFQVMLYYAQNHFSAQDSVNIWIFFFIIIATVFFSPRRLYFNRIFFSCFFYVIWFVLTIVQKMFMTQKSNCNNLRYILFFIPLPFQNFLTQSHILQQTILI